MFLMRALVHDGCPLSTVADTLLGNIGFRNEALYNLKRTKKEWLCRLLTAGNKDTHTDTLTDSLPGYKALECLDKDEEESQTVAYCGVIPEVVLRSRL